MMTELESQVAARTAELRLAIDQLHHQLAERRLSEQALRESEERFRNLADSAPVMIWVSGPDKLFRFFNKGWLNFRGRSLEQELGKSWSQGVHPEDQDRCLAIHTSAMDARRTFEMEYRLLRADGEYRWVLDRGVPRFAAGTFSGYIGSCIDVTELKRHQEQRAAAQKLESLGALAAGIAHDFNNLFAAILSESDLALSETVPGSPLRQSIERISAGTVRASEIVDLLLAYSGAGQPPSREPLDASAVIQELLLNGKVPRSKTIVLQAHLAKGLPAVWANRAQIERVILNLVTNACEALDGQPGAITVSTELLHFAPNGYLRRFPEVRAGEYVRIIVSDNGPGMKDQALTKIFDPFYTTKFLGRGLGLAVVEGIVRSLGGAVTAASTPGRGAAFAVLLPCTADSSADKARQFAAMPQ